MRSVIYLIFLVLLPPFASSSRGMIVTSQHDRYLYDGKNPVSAIKSASERLIAELSKFKGFENNATLKELESVLNVPSKSPF